MPLHRFLRNHPLSLFVTAFPLRVAASDLWSPQMEVLEQQLPQKPTTITTLIAVFCYKSFKKVKGNFSVNKWGRQHVLPRKNSNK